MSEQLPTVPTTIARIMADPAFKAGVADVRARRGYRRAYESPPGETERDRTNWRWNYERGRQWAIAAGSGVEPKGAKAARIFGQAIIP